jgi:peptidoglycan-associated lipoprotein
MRRITLALVFVTVGVPVASAQQRSADRASLVPRFDVSLGYNHISANAPPGQTDYFSLNGGYASGDLYLADWLSIAGRFTGSYANDISTLGQDLTLMTYTAGPRVSLTGHRLVPFGQVLFGGARGSNSYFPTGTTFSTSASSWALSTGGGLDINLTHRFAIRALDANYLRTALPNGASNEQNHLTVGAGIVIKFGDHDSPSIPIHVVDKRPGEILFTCGTVVASVEEGQSLGIVAHTLTKPDHLAVNYTWASTGGKIEGSGREVAINTIDLIPGDYHVTGQAVLVSDSSITADCDAAFRVTAHADLASTHAEVSTNPSTEQERKEVAFHENVQDALFDYDSAKIRPDAQAAIDHAAQYLNDNPSIRALVGGYADERGSAEYNLALGAERANAARNALIAAGVDPERIQVISYGKEAQVCTAENESCWQQNRRAAFSLHP